jgi:sporulation protein YlmC with PRC-barrel domain
LSKKRKSFKQDAPIQNKNGVKMEKANKPLTRDALVSMQVIDSKGRLVGKVKDIAFAVGKTGIVLSVETEAGEIQHVPWEDVQAASDFVLLKAIPQSTSQQQPVQTSSLTEEEKVFGPYEKKEQSVQTDVQQQSTQPLCPTCNQPLTWIPQYQRWYCYNEKKYVSVNEKQSTQRLCPTCNQPLTWIPQYQRWYCYNEKKYV